MPVGKPAPPRPRKPDAVTSARIASEVERQRALQALVAAMGSIIVERARIDHAAAREGQAGLPLEPGDLLRDTKPQRMRAVPKPSHRARSGIGSVTGPNAMRPCGVATSTIGSSQYRPREPVLTISIARPRFAAAYSSASATSSAPTATAPASRGRIDAHAHRCASATRASIRASSSRPTRRPSSIAEGAVAHSPRQ